MLFEVIIVQHPTKKDAEENGAMEKILAGPTVVVARDVQHAGMLSIMSNADKLGDGDKSYVEVVIRPFK